MGRAQALARAEPVRRRLSRHTSVLLADGEQSRAVSPHVLPVPVPGHDTVRVALRQGRAVLGPALSLCAGVPRDPRGGAATREARRQSPRAGRLLSGSTRSSSRSSSRVATTSSCCCSSSRDSRCFSAIVARWPAGDRRRRRGEAPRRLHHAVRGRLAGRDATADARCARPGTRSGARSWPATRLPRGHVPAVPRSTTSRAFYDDVVNYNAGGAAWTYPISGMGFSALLLALGVIPFRQADFPFAAIEVAVAAPIALWWMWRLWKRPTLATLLDRVRAHAARVPLLRPLLPGELPRLHPGRGHSGAVPARRRRGAATRRVRARDPRARPRAAGTRRRPRRPWRPAPPAITGALAGDRRQRSHCRRPRGAPSTSFHA